MRGKFRKLLSHTFFDVVSVSPSSMTGSGSSWISQGIKRPGELTRKATEAGAITQSGHIDVRWAQKMARGGPGVDPLTQKQAAYYVNILRPANMRRVAARKATHM